ncbi:vacuolar protein sorting-associated protein 51, putative [Plasmodium berghei]|uniref:Vacuolar protein sorting-associated protein 51, putative n=2 Tax=Plasmodium berghei TaxID=5821 RepID=A0A509ADP1_PLABA|nr:vacuolar protein sorting-associated protein 51, putative [Plasmodium berghei ANKA]SCL90244.1 vacuolar protein sorting-associated protein 51, putative [Plasmodium berghei]SCM15251.1 vacuolar protein sorting-associated protein 51, putative [Plasmodium berghei]SCN21921.1 vacuolar protein sorting-associated protein 51, putative [Plasmodium berghei]VUC53974.1 vacuolar protein sorting-associated protein 51, putative [Plasmodium berghei ANKA]|eukprot:XP_034419826.1 vacuolar protein sorting-associated protein 51, putative [Plasmodium berghei ANKA]
MINNLSRERKKSVRYLLNEYYNIENENKEIVTDLKITNVIGNAVKEYVSNTKVRKDTNDRVIDDKIINDKAINEGNRMNCLNFDNVETLNEMDELNKKSSEFNANIYFRKLLENSSLDDLINKSKKIEKEIKQNDNSIQSIVYENYNKFIYAEDIIVLVKNNFKKVKDKINLINQHIDYIDTSFKKTNKNISIEIEQVENIIQIKKLLKNINIIMQTPKEMFSLILKKKYIKALKLFIELIPFLYQNKHIIPFICLYMDCKHLENIACSLYFKFLHNSVPNITSENGKENKISNTTFFGENLKDLFQKLCSSIIPNNKLGYCFEVILSFGKDIKLMRNLFIQNRIIALKYLLCNIFNLGNYFHENDNNNSNKMEGIKNDDKFEENNFIFLENNYNIEKSKLNLKIFENIIQLVYEHLLPYFFEIIDNYENVFIKNENNSKEFTHSIYYTSKLISELNEQVKKKKKKIETNIKQLTKSRMIYDDNIEENEKKKKKKNDETTILMDENIYHELKEMWNVNCDKELIIILAKGFFRTLLNLKIDLLYLYNPSVEIIVFYLKKLINNVNEKEKEMKIQEKKLSGILSPILNTYIKKMLYTITKHNFYKLCYKNNLNFINFYNMCNNNDIYFIVENKNELHHKILLNLCLEIIDLKIFFEEIKQVSFDFFIKNIINFVTIYFIFLNNFLNFFIKQFVCVYNRIKDNENGNIDDNFEGFSELEFIYEHDLFKYNNIYSINCELDEIQNVEKEMNIHKQLSNYFYNSVNINNREIQNILKKLKKKLNIDYKEFIAKIVDENVSKLKKKKKIKEIYFLLALISIFNNFKKEGISKIFTILLNIYSESNNLVKGNKKLYFCDNLESIFYKDVYPFNLKNDKNMKDESKNSICDKIDEVLKKKNCKNINSNSNLDKNNEITVLDNSFCNDFQKKEIQQTIVDTKYVWNDENYLEKIKNKNLDKNQGQSLDGVSVLYTKDSENMEKNCEKNKHFNDSNKSFENKDNESDWREGTTDISENEIIKKEKWTKSIKKFAKNIFQNKCNELVNIYIFYYVNKMSNNIELCLEKWGKNIEERNNMISSSFLYVLKNVNNIYFTLNLILGGNKTKDINKQAYFEEICKKIKKEIKQINKIMFKEDNSNNVIDNNSNHFKSINILSPNIEQLNEVNIKENRNLEMYIYKLYIAKMKNYKKNIKLETKQVIFIIIKILFKNYIEFIRNMHINEYIFKNLKIDFVFYFYFLKHYISKDDENLLFVILNDVLISAIERLNKQVSSNLPNVYPTYLLDTCYYKIDKNIDLIQNKIMMK